MKMHKTISIVLIIATIILTIVSFILLPETVITQISTSGSKPTTMPKLFAVGLPALLGIGGGAFHFFDKSHNSKFLVVSAAGVVVFVVMLIVNL